MINRIIYIVIIVSASFYSTASIQVYKFNDVRKEQQFNQLVQELRCPKCQNNNLADSNSELSIDLKTIIYEKVIEGETNQEITNYLKVRYGDFITYRPPVKPSTWLIWFGPFVFLAVGAFSIFIFLSGRNNKIPTKSSTNVSEQSSALLSEWNDELANKNDDVKKNIGEGNNEK